jgi:nitric oxide reductase NorE protein
MERSIPHIQNWAGMDIGARLATLSGHRSTTRIPGELGIWAFLCADLIVFTLYFVTFLWERGQARAVFESGSHSLHLTIGVVNTLVLLTSSLFVALATQAVRNGKGQAGKKFIALAFAGGLVFIVNKPIEWLDKVRHGLTPHTDNFFQLYYMMTGLHLLHVIVGMVVLTFLWRLSGRVRALPSARQVRFLESGATYWHLVDLIWLVLFALFYLLK